MADGQILLLQRREELIQNGKRIGRKPPVQASGWLDPLIHTLNDFEGSRRPPASKTRCKCDTGVIQE